jgi:hypothetical protein
MLVHQTYLVLFYGTLSNEIFCGSFILIENLVVCVPSTTVKQILFLNHRNRKVVGGKDSVLEYYMDLVHPTYLVLFYGTLSNEIFCGSFILIENLVMFVCLPQQ